MQSAFELMRKVSSAQFPVLIMGETGTGKGLAAVAIHASGPRQDKPYFALDCAALVPSLIETELFGHARGAFTGAAHSKTGLLEMAPEGTLLLDEIGELPMNSQSRLLSAIEEKKLRPVGSNNYQPFRARIIATTNRNLDEEVREGRFRKDLVFRLNGLVIHLPPLRERKEDIPMLCKFWLDRLSDSFNGSREQHRWELSSEAMDCLLAYDWPGNVRELRSCLERSLSLGTYPIIQPSDLLLHGRSPLFEMMFIPSGGGQWVVQGPIMIPAAMRLGVSPAVTAMAVAFGDQNTNMLQPFWALPVLAVANLSVRDVMGYCVMTFLLSFALSSLVLFLLV